MARRPSGRPRVVLDTNVVVSALVFEGDALQSLRNLWQTGEILPLLSTGTATELVRVLHYPKFRLTGSDREVLLGEYLPWCETVRIPTPAPAPIIPCRDPSDLPFLELALAGRADFLVTGDADLHAVTLPRRSRFAIVTTAALLQRIREG